MEHLAPFLQWPQIAVKLKQLGHFWIIPHGIDWRCISDQKEEEIIGNGEVF